MFPYPCFAKRKLFNSVGIGERPATAKVSQKPNFTIGIEVFARQIEASLGDIIQFIPVDSQKSSSLFSAMNEIQTPSTIISARLLHVPPDYPKLYHRLSGIFLENGITIT